MAQLGRFDYTVQTTLGLPATGASVNIYREGATVNGNQSGVSPLAVTVRHAGKIATGDMVFINATTGTTYAATRTSSTVVTLSGFGGTLNVSGGDRITPSNSQPTLYGDDQAGATTSNPLTTSSTGRANCWMEFGAYDFVVSGGGTTTTAFTSQVMPTEAPAQVRYASAFPGADGGAQISNAIADLPAAGGVVDARGITGTITVGTTITINVPCTLLIGQATLTGSVDPIISVTSDDVAIVGEHYSFSAIQQTTVAANVVKLAAGSDRITIRGLLLDGAGKTIDTANVTQGNCIWAAGTSASPVTELVLEGCRLIDGHNGIYASQSDRCRIVNNVFAFTHNALAQCYLDACTSCIVRGNVFTDTGTTSNAVWLDMDNDDPSIYCVIANNTVTGAYDHEVFNIMASYTSITGNVINVTTAAATLSGINIEEPAYANSSGQCHHNSVVGNVYLASGTSAGSNGISVRDSSASHYGCNNNVISGNVLRLTGFGIVVNNYCSHNDITGNRVDIQTGDTVDGIILTGPNASDNLVVGNRVTTATRHGIHCNTSIRNVVAANHCSSCTTDGIRMANSTNSSMVGNLMYNNTGAGGYVTSTTENRVVSYWNNAPTNTTSGVKHDAQSITGVGVAVTPYSSVHLFTSDGNYTLTVTPTIADGFNDEEVLLINVGANTVTLQDQGSLASSNLRLTGASRALGPRDSIRLIYNSTVGDWIEIGFTNVT